MSQTPSPDQDEDATFDRFVAVAREFVEWATSPATQSRDEAERALVLLTRLYSAGLSMSEAPIADDEGDGEAEGVSDEMWRRVYERAGCLPFNDYSSVLDPHEVPAKGTGTEDLADDIADVYRDLKDGLNLLDSGCRKDAWLHFRMFFWIHWGQHAVSAMGALHVWCARNED